jgi:hypothetical protein
MTQEEKKKAEGQVAKLFFEKLLSRRMPAPRSPEFKQWRKMPLKDAIEPVFQAGADAGMEEAISLLRQSGIGRAIAIKRLIPPPYCIVHGNKEKALPSVWRLGFKLAFNEALSVGLQKEKKAK